MTTLKGVSGSPTNERDFLVIGYGNTLRRDDGAGAKVAEAVEALGLPGVSVRVCHQLTPELAEIISRSTAVVFVDAAVDVGEVGLKEIQANDSSEVMAHHTDPRSLLRLAKDVFGRCPRAWTVAIPAEDLGFGDGLSPRAEAGYQAALAMVEAMVRRFQAESPSN